MNQENFNEPTSSPKSRKSFIVIVILIIILIVLGYLVYNYGVGKNEEVLNQQTAQIPIPYIEAKTYDATDITRSEATLNGEAAAYRGAYLTSTGFHYGLTSDYGETVSSVLAGAGDYSLPISNLSCSETYHFRAYADGEVPQPRPFPPRPARGTGEDKTFKTASCPSHGGSSAVPSGIWGADTIEETAEAMPETETPPETTGTPAPSETPAPAETPTSANTLSLRLAAGSRGEEVKYLQAGLNEKINAGLVIDGIFGPLTKAAVIKFQLANNLAGDGIVGPLTREKFNQ